MAADGTAERPTTRPGADPDRLLAHVQELSERVDALPDERAREVAEALTAAIVELYGAGIERIVDIVGRDAPATLDALAADDLVAGLLLIHDLFPVPLEQRVADALERVRPYMDSHGGDVELLGVEDGIAHLRLQGSCSTCHSSTATLELAVRQALDEVAPDLVGMDVENVTEAETPGSGLPMAAPAAPPAWFAVDEAALPLPGLARQARVGDASLVVANVEGTLLAYRDACAACGGALHRGALVGGTLTCPACGHAFALPRAGRSEQDAALQLEPVPLLRDERGVQVALAT